ncbi:MAG: hypothetical protein ABI343_08825 [Burkholderiaceae bacterium]
MKRDAWLWIAGLSLAAGNCWAWSNHTLVSYRALEIMPEVASASAVVAEPLEDFLKGEEKALEALLASQEAWARANLDPYAVRPDALAFKADPTRTDAQRRLAFLNALRLNPSSKFALFLQTDPRGAIPAAGNPIPESAVNILPDHENRPSRFLAIKPGQSVSALTVVASGADEPDYGLDINLWQDSPSDWGKVYGFGPLPFGNPALSFSTQAPFHMGFYYQDWIIFKAAPFLRRTYPLLRVYQYSTLAGLAFRSGHDYWGWRFAGLALHYVQDLTQPYHASLAPGVATVRLIGVNTLAMAGWTKPKDDLVVLLSNRHLALEKYQHDSMLASALAHRDTALEAALRNSAQDANYPAWFDLYLRDVVARESYDEGEKTVAAIVAAVPPHYVSDPSFDFGVNEGKVDLLDVMAKQDPVKRAALDRELAVLLGHFGAHSRNALRGILRASGRL